MKNSSDVRTCMLAICVGLSACLTSLGEADEITASGTAAGFSASGAMDGERFSSEPNFAWKCNAAAGWWRIQFLEPRQIGAILQVNGDDPHLLRNAPRNYVWQQSLDGQSWTNLAETVVCREKRMFHIHRLRRPITAGFLRLKIYVSEGDSPTLREVEFYSETDAKIEFDDWIVAISSSDDPKRREMGMPFVKLARQCEGWEKVPAQLIWHGDFDQPFVETEPRPLCVFLSGSLLEWCQCSREPWRGVQEVLRLRSLPIWGACGGAQILAILEETGVDQPWDCPRCRDPEIPLLPIYSHIGHTGTVPCGDYSQNLAERGKFKMKQVADDPAFDGLPEVFEIMESHVGQIAHVPEGWTRVVTKGPGALTVNQCIRVKDHPIYAAQFHIEMAGTPENSRKIMANFLREAQEWRNRNAPQKPPREGNR